VNVTKVEKSSTRAVTSLVINLNIGYLGANIGAAVAEES